MPVPLARPHFAFRGMLDAMPDGTLDGTFDGMLDGMLDSNVEYSRDATQGV